MTTHYKMIKILITILASLVFITGCSAYGERVQSQSIPENSMSTDTKNPVTDSTTDIKNNIKEDATTPARDNIDSVTKTVVPVIISKQTTTRSSIYLGSDGKMAGIGDPNKPSSEAYKIGMMDRPAALAGAGLPKDKFGLVDWVAVVKQGVINPVGNLEPGKPDIPPFEMDILIKSKGDFVNNVLFPHDSHTYWLSCENCHPAIFAMSKGKNKMSMVEIGKGKWCGKCHGKVAFPLTDCSRCHTKKKVPQKDK